MIAKTLFAAAALTAAVAATAPAHAGVDVDLNVGMGGFEGGYAGYAPYPVYDGYGYERPRARWGVSCDDGRDQVRWAGFRRVVPLDCGGRRLTYQARRHGGTFIVQVSRRSGDIVSVREMY